MPAIAVERLLVEPYQMNCYLVENLHTKGLFVVDAGGEGSKIIQAVGNRKPVAVLATHGHYDHIGGVDEVCAHFGIPLYIHGADIPKLTDPWLNASERFFHPMTIDTGGIPVEEGQRLCLADIEVTVMHTPGHSAGSCCFLLPEDQGIFCGDTLFDRGYGRTDLEDSSFHDLKQSLRRLLSMKPRIVAYPGHGASTFAGRDEESR